MFTEDSTQNNLIFCPNVKLTYFGEYNVFFYRACVVLGVVFILSALTILVKAIHALATKVLPEVVRNDSWKSPVFYMSNHHTDC